MNREIKNRDFLSALLLDERMSVWHVSMFAAILHCWAAGDFRNPVQITRRKIMQLSHIHALATYHKCIKELVAFGYIGYLPSYNPFLGSLIYLNRDPRNNDHNC